MTAGTLSFRVEVPWTWDMESQHQKPQSLQKVSNKSPGAASQKSAKKVSKKVREVPKTHSTEPKAMRLHPLN